MSPSLLSSSAIRGGSIHADFPKRSWKGVKPVDALIRLLLLWPADAYNFAFYSLLGYLTSDATHGGARNTSRVRRDTHLGTAARAVRVAKHAATHTTYNIRARRPERRI